MLGLLTSQALECFMALSIMFTAIMMLVLEFIDSKNEKKHKKYEELHREHEKIKKKWEELSE